MKTINVFLLLILVLVAGFALNVYKNKEVIDSVVAEENNLRIESRDIEEEIITEKPKKHYKIVALGDSLTAGFGLNKSDSYPSQLERRLTTKGYNVTVINHGISGDTSEGVLKRLNKTLEEKPDIVILTIGANDAYLFNPTNKIKENIAEIIEILNEQNITVVLGGMYFLGGTDILSIADYIIDTFNISEEYVNVFLKSTNYVELYRGIYVELAKEEDVEFIPFFLEGVAGNPTLNQADYIHPTAEGYTIIVERNVLPVIEPLLY